MFKSVINSRSLKSKRMSNVVYRDDSTLQNSFIQLDAEGNMGQDISKSCHGYFFFSENDR